MVFSMAKWSTGVKRVGRKTYRVVKAFGAWIITHLGRIVAVFVNGVVHALSREVSKQLARRIFATKA